MPVFNKYGVFDVSDDVVDSIMDQISIATDDYLNLLISRNFTCLDLRVECHEIELYLITNTDSGDKDRDEFIDRIRDYTKKILELADEKEYKAVEQYIRETVSLDFGWKIFGLGLEMMNNHVVV